MNKAQLEADLCNSVVRCCRLKVMTKGDSMVLCGSVHSFFQKQIAIHLAQKHGASCDVQVIEKMALK